MTAQMQEQIRVLTTELELLKQEIVGVKAAHAAMHQSSVDAGAASQRLAAEQSSRIGVIEGKFAGLERDAGTIGTSSFGKSRPLIEPKQISVEVFAGALNDTRGKFLDWCEKIKDRSLLYSKSLGEALQSLSPKRKAYRLEFQQGTTKSCKGF